MKQLKKTLSRILLILALVTTTSLSSSCYLVQPAPVKIEIPARPTLPDPIVPPDIHGKAIRDDGGQIMGIFIDTDTVGLIQEYVADLKERMAIIETMLKAHIEKLENRLKAINGSK